MSGKDVVITRTASGVKATLNRDASSPLRVQSNVLDATSMFGEGGMRAMSGLISRLQLANIAGKSFGGKRDLWNVFGYERNLTPELFLAKYVRQDIASRIVDAPPNAVWASPPEIIENDDLKVKWEALVEKHMLWGAMQRADRLARLNSFSILLFGFDDGTKLETPLGSGREVKDLLYLRPIGARQITELSFNDDPASPEFGQPNLYKVDFDDPSRKVVTTRTVTTIARRTLTIHSSRVVHIVENPLEDSVFGIPIMEKVYNLLDDLLKVAGGTPETYWLTANRGMQADIDKDMDLDPTDTAALSDELEEYMHQLRRVLRTRGVKINVLDSETPKPKETFEMLMALLSGTTGIPRRILLGSEAGQLASEQDRANWAERIVERRVLFAEPIVLKPVLTMFQSVGLLPEGKYKLKWPSAFILSPLEGSMVMAQTARAVGNLSRQLGNKVPMQITSVEEARTIVELEGDLPDSEKIEPPEEDVPTGPPGGNVREDDDKTRSKDTES